MSYDTPRRVLPWTPATIEIEPTIGTIATAEAELTAPLVPDTVRPAGNLWYGYARWTPCQLTLLLWAVGEGDRLSTRTTNCSGVADHDANDELDLRGEFKTSSIFVLHIHVLTSFWAIWLIIARVSRGNNPLDSLCRVLIYFMFDHSQNALIVFHRKIEEHPSVAATKEWSDSNRQ